MAPVSSDPDPTAVVDDPLLGRLATADGLFITNEDQRIETWSASAERMLGFTPDQVVGRPCWLVLMGREPDGHPVCRRSCPVTKNARRGRGTASYEVTARTRDGGTRLVWNSVVVLEGDDGFRVMHLLRDAPATPLPESRRVDRRVESAIDLGRPTSSGDGMPPIGTLTRRELEALRVFAEVASLEEAAEALGISAFTARNHIASVQRKLGARSRVEMVLVAQRHGLI